MFGLLDVSQINWSDPINWSHPFALGLKGFWLAVPGRYGHGTIVWRDLCGKNNLAAVAATTPSALWGGPYGRRGGAGSGIYNGSTNGWFVNVGIITAEPFTMACCFNVSDVTVGYTLMFTGDKDDNDLSQHILQVRGDIAGDPVRAITVPDAAAAVAADTSTAYAANVWNTGIGAWAAGNSRAAYLNGRGGVTETTATTVTGIDRFAVGVSYDSTPTRHMAGRIDAPMFYNRAFSDQEAIDWTDLANQGFPDLLNRTRRFWWAGSSVAAEADEALQSRQMVSVP